MLFGTFTMPSVHTTLDFLANLPRYETEKPFQAFPLADHLPADLEPSSLSNVEFHPQKVEIHDLRNGGDFNLSTSGFQLITDKVTSAKIDTIEAMEKYKADIEKIIYNIVGADFVKCFDCKRFRKKATMLLIQCSLRGLRLVHTVSLTIPLDTSV